MLYYIIYVLALGAPSSHIADQCCGAVTAVQAAGPILVGNADGRGQYCAHDGGVGRRVPGAWPGRIPAARLQGGHPCLPGACLLATYRVVAGLFFSLV